LVLSRTSKPLLCPATATPVLPTLSLHDALPIYAVAQPVRARRRARQPAHFLGQAVDVRHPGRGEVVGVEVVVGVGDGFGEVLAQDRKSTRLNSSHVKISYAVFCLKKKKDRAHTT